MTAAPTPPWLAAFPGLSAIADPAWRRAIAEARMVRLPAGHVAFRSGEACRNYLMVSTGTVRVQMFSESGREIVLYRVGPGETCVLTTSCLFAGAHYPAEGVCETEVSAALLPWPRFHETVAGSEGFRRFVFAAFGERLGKLMQLVEAVAFARVDRRLAERLLTMTTTHNPVRATHQQLAAELGSAREVVSRLLKEFERDDLVSLGRGEIEVRDRAGLERLASR